MRLAIMQPYFVPYIGYFQLMASVDKLILLDDVNFINRGWINRNRIAVNGESYWITIPLVKASQNRPINEIGIIDEPSWKRKMLRTVEMSYCHAPQVPQILPFFSGILEQASGPLSTFLFRQLKAMATYLGLTVQIEEASANHPKEGYAGQQRILHICAREGADTYVNLPGGRELYDPAKFAGAGIQLAFLESNFPAMSLHHGGRDGPLLSILDLIMLNSVATVRDAISMARLSSD